jgi:hypothetical protein
MTMSTGSFPKALVGGANKGKKKKPATPLFGLFKPKKK